MTALDILNRWHQKIVTDAGVSSIHTKDFPVTYQQQALAAMREITEKTWEEAINYDRYQHPYPSKDEFLKELFPEK